MLFDMGELIEQTCSRVNHILIAGRFGHLGLHQLHAKQSCAQLTRPMSSKCPAITVDWFCYRFAQNNFPIMLHYGAL